MPLLRRQPFVKQNPPDSVKEDDDVFFCRLTGEVFDDYEKFFERIILCNSLVWTCEVTGKSGLTFQEAVESEEKAQKQLASFPSYLRTPILYLATLTHRPRLNDLNDDVFTYAKDRYFIKEIVEVLHGGEKKTCTVIQIIAPTSKKVPVTPSATNGAAGSDSDSDVICLDDPVPLPKSPKTPKGSPKPAKSPKSAKKDIASKKPIDPEKFQYVVQEVKKPSIFVVKAELVSRKKGLYTRDKSKLFLKKHCENSGDGIWRVKAKHAKKLRLGDIRFEDIFEGLPPKFTVAYCKKKPPGSSKSSSAVIDLTGEEEALRKAKKEYKNKKKEKKESETKDGKKKKNKIPDAKNRKITEFLEVCKTDANFLNGQCGTTKEMGEMGLEASSIFDIDVESDEKTDELKAVKLTPEERTALKEKAKAEKMAEKIAKKEEMKKIVEEEKQKRKEEREKLRLLKMEEKIKREQLLKEWSKPRDDMECDDLKDMPLPTAINCHFPAELFGDVLMVLEYITCFTSLFDLAEEFPQGIDLDDFGKAIMSSDTNGLFADVLRVLLCAVFNLQEEEDEDDEEADDQATKCAVKDLEEGGSLSYKQLVESATKVAMFPNMNLGAPLKKLHLDGFTITEIVRLHFLSSGARASEKSTKFRYQQRGGYTSYDDAGLEFRKEEPNIIKALGESNVFDFPAADKLKVLTALINQLLTFVTSRDFIEDNFEKLRQVRNDVRQLQWEEQRRERDEATFWYKKRIEDRQKERELEAEKKAQKKKEKEDKLRVEEGSPSKPIDVDMEDKEDAKDSPKENQKEAERKSSRQRAILIAKEEKEDLPVENIDWEKITPDERVRMKERFYKKESQFMDLIQELSHGNAIYCLGRDRTYRRFWKFRSLPGLFVEDNEEYINDDCLCPVDQNASSNPLLQCESEKRKILTMDEKNTSSDKENESFDGSSNAAKAVSADKLNGAPERKPTLESRAILKESVHEQIKNRNSVKWAYYNTPDQISMLIESLNPRGYREGPLKQSLLEQKQHLTTELENCPTRVLSLPRAEEESDKQMQAVSVKVKSRNKTTQGTVRNGSAQEFLELNLRESLLDIEERIFVGTLGAMKIDSREKWRDAIENGSYDQQTSSLIWSGKPSDYLSPTKATRITGVETDDDSDDEEASPVVRDLAKALLQISQGLESKYLGQPLGEALPTNPRKKTTQKSTGKGKSGKSKGKGKREEEAENNEDSADSDKESDVKQPSPRERWEASLMGCTSLPQIFLHLSAFDSSILWTKSALHARCRICRRKGDGEHMLLCDGCDRGHHMYCLKPQVKKVPVGDWFCPDCKPKEVPRTPRKRRKSFAEQVESEDDEDQESESEADSESADSSDDSDADEESGDEDDEDDDEGSDSEDESEEEQPVKIKFVRGPRKQTSSGRSTPTIDSTKRTLKSSSSSSSLLNGRGGKGKAIEKSSGRSSARNSLEPPKGKATRRSLEPSKGRRSQEPEKPLEKYAHLQPKGLRASRSTSCLSDMAKPGLKRKAEKHEDTPESKRASTSKVRKDENIQQMKLLEDLLNEMCDRKESWPFLTPVTKRDAPDYFQIVKKPMDFRTIRSKILKIEYLEPGPIIQDIRLTFQNCEQYNMPSAPEYGAGQKMSKYFEKRLKESKLDHIVSRTAAKDTPSPKKKQRRI